MTAKKNIHGLSRNIPEPIKRKVRQRDGFGCIFCAVPIIEYEHVDPVFVEAEKHDADAITLLCPTCHTKVTGGQISKELVKDQMKDPAALKGGQIGDQLRFIKSHPSVIVGGATFIEVNVPIKFLNQDIISIKYYEGSYFLNANFWDSNGQRTLKIVDNEWSVAQEGIWDLTVEGNTITIREKEKKPTLVFKVENNDTLRIERIEMNIAGNNISGNDKILKINGHRLQAVSMRRCGVGISIGLSNFFNM